VLVATVIFRLIHSETSRVVLIESYLFHFLILRDKKTRVEIPFINNKIVIHAAFKSNGTEILLSQSQNHV
jgi:hypothetical protein